VIDNILLYDFCSIVLLQLTVCIYRYCVYLQLHHITTATLVWLYSRTDLNKMFLPVVVALLAFSCYRPLIIEYGLISALKISYMFYAVGSLT